MQPNITIRTYRPKDLLPLTELYNAILDGSLSPEEVHGLISRYGCEPERDRFVALQGDALVGMSVLIAQSPPALFC